MPRNLSFCSFASFLIVSLTPFINKPDSLRGLTFSMISSILSFEIINVAISDVKNFFWKAASVAEAADVNPNGTRALLANGLSKFPILNVDS